MSARTRELPRRSCLSIPGSSERFLGKGPSVAADMVILDLEDSVVPSEKEAARGRVVDAVKGQDWGDQVVCVRVNAWDSLWTVFDVIDVVGGAGERLDEVMLPKVQSAAEVVALDLVLGQVEAAAGLAAGHVGIEVQIETARGLVNVEEICAASPRIEAVVFGPADFSASVELPGIRIPEYPLSRILVAGRAAGIQVIDGPFFQVRDQDALRQDSERTRSLGYDGKWAVHPDQVPVLNEVFAPSLEQFNKAVALLDAYRKATEGDDNRRGAVMFDGAMIDEASRKVALKIVARGERAGLGR
jgi:citrate lyase subunit beta/citryl-CoA lyase